MNQEISIKRASLDQVDIIRDLAIQTFKETFGQDNEPEELQAFFETDYSIAQLTKELQEPQSQVDVLYLNHLPVGFLKINWGSSQTEEALEDAIEIQRIYILKAYQRQGLGKELFDYALNLAQESGKSWVWLGVWEHNVKAQRFYQKYGFEKFGEHQFLVGQKVDTDWLLKKALK